MDISARHCSLPTGRGVFLFLVVLCQALCSPASAMWRPTSIQTHVAAYLFTFPAPPEEEPDDRLPRKLQQRVGKLTRQLRPEKVEQLLSKRPIMDRIHIARAYALAGVETEDLAQRDAFLEKAAREYHKVIQLQNDPDWSIGFRRWYHLAQWRIELADLILRHWIAPDLDRFEITSGLDFDRARLTERLRRALAAYTEAGSLLDDLMVGLRTEEERFLLLGIANGISALCQQRELNAAWAGVYLAMVTDPNDPGRDDLLSTALSAFDTLARAEKDPDRKYNALLGAGIALRLAGRYSESDAAFDRVLHSTASFTLAARARYERARCLIEARRFEKARQELAALAGIPATRLEGEDSGAAFYVRLAPLIHAYAYLREAQTVNAATSNRKRSLQKKAEAALAALSDKGGIRPEIVQLYMEAFGDAHRDPADLSDVELRLKVGRLMADDDHAQAADLLNIILQRPSMREFQTEARFNLGVCRFQSQDLRAAAEAFTKVASTADDSETAEKAAEYAYRCRRQLANNTQTGDDYRRLAETAELLTQRFPAHALNVEAAWVAALARQESGDFRAAITAYEKVSASAEHYWTARRNQARCRQRLYETLPPSASDLHRRRTGEASAAAWSKLADDLSAFARTAEDPDFGALPFDGPAELEAWINAARLSAATQLASDGVCAFRGALDILANMLPTARVLGLRIRCHRGLGDLRTAKLVLDDFLEQASDRQLGSVLVALAAEMEAEIVRLREKDRPREAARMAADAVDTIQQLLDWIKTRPEHDEYVPVVRLSLVGALIQAGRHAEATDQLDRLMADDPESGSCIHAAARLQEDVARRTPAEKRRPFLDKAESLWARLLKDKTLREKAPDVYWEARYHWLGHQLRHGRAAEVVKGIETERAWYPQLGGRPWQGRLLKLAEDARAGMDGARR